MKKIYGFAALCAAMTLASCSNNDEPTPAGGQQVETQRGYLSVTLATPGSSETRADGDYVEGESSANATQGTVAESEVKSAYLITFSTIGGATTVHQIVPFSPKPWYDGTDTDNNIDKVSSENIVEVEVPTIQVDGENVDQLDKFITVLNINPSTLGIKKGDSFDTVRKTLSDYSSVGNGIAMSTSAYNKSTTGTPDLVYATDAKIFKDLADAQKTENIVTVYVERNVARADYSFKTGGIDKTPATDVKVDGNVKDMAITVTGVTIANVPEKAYLVKNIDGISTWGTFNNSDAGFQPNVPTHFRSHWADAAPIKPATEGDTNYVTFTNYSYSTIVGDNGTDMEDITAAFTKKSKYLNENTSDQKTCVLITAQVGNGDDIYRMVVNNKYYSTTDNLFTAALGYLEVDGYYKKDANGHFVSLAKEDLTLVHGTHGYDGYIQFGAGLQDNLYKTTNPSDVNAYVLYEGEDGLKDANAELVAATWDSKRQDPESESDPKDMIQLEKYRVYKWNGGRCYYYTDINPKFVNRAGVVRNHIYNLNLNGVVGMGVPVFDPKDIIIPEVPDKVDPKDPENYYVRATINILNWTYYSQDVIFETPEQ